MYPLTIALAVETKELWEDVQRCLETLPVRVVIEQQDLAGSDVFVDRLERMRPEVVVIDISRLREHLEEIVRGVRVAVPEAMIVAVHTAADAETILASLRAGVNEYLYPPLEGSLRKALERKSSECGQRRDSTRQGGRSLAFFSAKGGCGATTIAVHVAVELGRLERKVLLADLDMDSGLVSFLLKTKSPYSIVDAVNNLHRLDASYWKALVSNGIPNLEIIPAPASAAAGQAIAPDQLRSVIGFVRSQYDFTVLDLGRSLNRLTMDALGEVDEGFLVTTLEVPALHQAKQMVQRLMDSGYGKSRLRLVLNRVPKRMDITTQELEKMLGLPVHSMLPDDYPELYECYAEGRLLSRNSTLGKHMARVSAKVAGIEEDKGKRRFSLFG